MTNYSSRHKKTARIIPLVSGFLFWIFSLAYLAFFQGDMLVLKTYALFDVVIGAWLLAAGVTFILFLLALGLNRLTDSYQPELAYLPSFLLLGLITFSPEGWQVFPFLLTVIGFIIGYLYLRHRNDLNAIILRMIFLCLLTLSMGNTNERYHLQRSIEIKELRGK